MNYAEIAAGFALLADPTRLRILAQLDQGEDWQSATQLLAQLPICQPTLSHHMKLLWQGGLVERRRQGQRTLYRLDRAALAALLTDPLTAPAGEGTPLATTPPKEAVAAPRPPAVIVRTGHKW